MKKRESTGGAKKKLFLLKAIVWLLAGISVMLAGYVLIPGSVMAPRVVFPFIAALAFAFFLLGAALIILTIKRRVEGKLKIFLILTGVSAVGILVSAVLHNIVYGLFSYWLGADFWTRTGLGDEPFFFFMTIFICPIAFIVGVIGSIVLFAKKK